jgi:hypothetical protein
MGNECADSAAMNLRPLLRLLVAGTALLILAGCANFPANTPTAAAPQPPAKTTAP